MRIGYIRVSTQEQNPDRQIAAMRDFGLTDDELVIEAQSGKDFYRPLYKRAVGQLGPGDLFVVKSIDRFGRNYAEILDEWWLITKTLGADIVVLDMPLLDTRQGRDLTGRLIADIVLQLLSYVAQTERELIRQRQKEGIAAAKARGVRFGRKRVLKPDNYPDIALEYRYGMIPAYRAADKLGVSRNTFLRWINEEEKKEDGQLQF